MDGTMSQQLSARELQVANLIMQGLSYTEIGEELALSPNTVKTHRMNLYLKLGINSRRELFALKRTRGRAFLIKPNN